MYLKSMNESAPQRQAKLGAADNHPCRLSGIRLTRSRSKFDSLGTPCRTKHEHVSRNAHGIAVISPKLKNPRAFTKAACRCRRCKRTVRYLAADLLPIIEPEHRVRLGAPFPHGKSGRRTVKLGDEVPNKLQPKRLGRNIPKAARGSSAEAMRRRLSRSVRLSWGRLLARDASR